MHYRNDREAKNGDKIVKLGEIYSPDGKPIGGSIVAVGVLHSAVPGNDYCNGMIAPIQQIPSLHLLSLPFSAMLCAALCTVSAAARSEARCAALRQRT